MGRLITSAGEYLITAAGEHLVDALDASGCRMAFSGVSADMGFTGAAGLVMSFTGNAADFTFEGTVS